MEMGVIELGQIKRKIHGDDYRGRRGTETMANVTSHPLQRWKLLQQKQLQNPQGRERRSVVSDHYYMKAVLEMFAIGINK